MRAMEREGRYNWRAHMQTLDERRSLIGGMKAKTGGVKDTVMGLELDQKKFAVVVIG